MILAETSELLAAVSNGTESPSSNPPSAIIGWSVAVGLLAYTVVVARGSVTVTEQPVSIKGMEEYENSDTTKVALPDVYSMLRLTHVATEVVNSRAVMGSRSKKK